jgi:protein phosphatase
MTTEASDNLMVKVGGYSEAGIRESNQDAFSSKNPMLASELKYKGIVACIADGVSCSSNAQQASHTSVTEFVQDYYCTPDSWSVKKSAGQVLHSLNRWLYQHGSQQELRHNGSVTTFSSVIFKSTAAYLFHVGDSRIYRLRDGELTQLTRDHIQGQYGKRHFLVRALGMDINLDIDYQKEDLQKGDLFLLTSDGIHDWLSHSELTQSLLPLTHLDTLNSAQLEASTQQLADKAITAGSNDNLSALAVYIEHVPQEGVTELFKQLTQFTIPPALGIGNELDHYTITKVLYSGPRSHIYLAINQHDKQNYVLKVPSLNFTEDIAYLEGFAKEQWVGRKLKHRAIMNVFPRPENSQFLYHVCEVIEGYTLRQWMYDNPAPSLERVREIVKDILIAVRVFQRAGMVHRDLKPENIMITQDNHIKIIDFGTVQIDGIDEIRSPLNQHNPLGAVNYIAPEYLHGEQASTRSDLFSVAVITYEMLTGELPYKTLTTQSITQARHIKWKYRSAITYRNDLPLWIDSTLRKACHPLPQRRYEAKSEFIADLYTPNNSLITDGESGPLISRNPVRFWQYITLFFLFMALVEFYIIFNL